MNHWFRRLWWGVLFLTTILLALRWSWSPKVGPASHMRWMATSLDVRQIVEGYRATPDLMAGFLRWMQGSWLHTGTACFRPLGGVFAWIECWIGFHYGFIYVSALGAALFALSCALATLLTWRLTGSRIATSVAALLAPALVFFNPGQPGHWIFWFPGHPEHLVACLVLATLLCFEGWVRNGRPALLAGTWAAFLVTCLVKEYGYCIPMLLLALVWLKPGRVARRAALRQALATVAAVLLLNGYRLLVVPEPYGPTLKIWQIVYKSLFYMYSAFGQEIAFNFPVYSVFAILLFACGGLLLRLLHKGGAEGRRGWYGLVALVLLTIVYAVQSDTYLFLFEAQFFWSIGTMLVTMLLLLGTVGLLIKHRRRYPTALVWLLLYVSYVPHLDFGGWHYGIIPWCFRAVYWGLIAQVVVEAYLNPAVVSLRRRFRAARGLQQEGPDPVGVATGPITAS